MATNTKYSPIVHYCTLREDLASSQLAEYLRELCTLLGQSAKPFVFHVRELNSAEIAHIIAPPSPETISNLSERVVEKLYCEHGHARTVICCPKEHDFASLARKENKTAYYGVRGGCVALVYGSTDKRVIWHEALHLFDAKDCYDTVDPVQNPGPTCEPNCPNCIMQFDPACSNIEKWPFLCEENIARVQSAMSASHN